MKNLLAPRSLPVATASLLALAVLTSSAFAGSRSVTAQGARGGSLQRQVSHSPGATSAAGSVTLPDGRTASRSLTTQRTDTGRTTSAQATGFNGQTATYDSTRTATDTGYVRQATATGPQGATATKQVVVARQNGTITRSVTTAATPAKP